MKFGADSRIIFEKKSEPFLEKVIVWGINL